jgi:hypothetical protein
METAPESAREKRREDEKERERRRRALLAEFAYTEEEVALMLNIDVKTLRNRHADGKSHPPRTPERLYPKKEFHAWNAERLEWEASAERRKRRA